MQFASLRAKPLATFVFVLGAVAGLGGAAWGDEPLPSQAPAWIRVPDPLSGENPGHRLAAEPVPEPGKPFSDARFGTRLTRVTAKPGLRHEYSRYDPFNRDRSKIVLLDPPSGELRVYRADSPPYDRPEKLIATLDLEQPRWDVTEPNLLWGLRDFQIRTHDFATGKTKVVKDFARDPAVAPLLQAGKDLYRITTKDEGEPSRDMRYWALGLQGSKDDYRLRHLLTWDRSTDRVLGVYELSKAEEIDWVGMSWSGTFVLIGADPGQGKISGLTMADRELSRFHRLDFATGHADVALDDRGSEVIVMQNARTDYIDAIPIDWKTQPILENGGSYDGTGRTPLVRLFASSESPVGLNSGVHISCNVPGWCVVSTYIEPELAEQNWLDRSILLVRVSGRRREAFYLAKVHATCGAYWEETQAALSNDGSRVVWADNWGQDVGQERSFLMQLDMPDHWRERLE